MKVRRTVSAFWALAKPFWTSEERFKALGLLALVLSAGFLQTYMFVLGNRWNAEFYDAVQKMDVSRVIQQLLVWSAICGGMVVFETYENYFWQTLELHWRTWMNSKALEAWLAAASGKSP
ncbi:MAG: hypothetical protein HY074_18430 [Deltaproteobacteria bacterium]|nr:hypothetical protein [Deltaproteobacteria bacterium]